jgi:hypothetical protein
MQESHLFEYAVIRVVPRVEREEFINVGIILFCKKQRFLQTKFTLDKQRLKAFAPLLDVEEVEKNLQAYARISAGAAGSGPIGRLDAASRFRWLTATRSTVVQSSKVHPGLCHDLPTAVEKLYAQLVL